MLSVLIPAYNSEKYIRRCINSVICQTYKDIEIIIIDDGSIDRTKMICLELGKSDERIKLISQMHSGVAAARKNGIRIAMGECIAFVDSDDWIELDYFEKLMKRMENCDVLITSHIKEPGHNVIEPAVEPGIYCEENMKLIWNKVFNGLFGDSISGVLWDKIFRSDVIKPVIKDVPDELYINEDHCMEACVLLSSAKVKVVNIAGYHYCINEGSTIRSIYKNYLINLHYYYHYMLNVIKGHSYEAVLSRALDREMVLRLRYSCLDILGIDESVRQKEIIWYYPYYGRLAGTRLILYCAGKVGQSFYLQIKNDKESKIAAWVDKDYEKYANAGWEVKPPDEIARISYDYIVLAISDEQMAHGIKSELISMGIPEEVILWSKTKPIMVLQ